MRRLVRGFAAALAALGGVVLSLAALLPLPDGLVKPASQVVLDADGGWLRVFATPDAGGMWRVPVAREELPPAFVRAVLAFEDRRFYRHPGVDPLALLRAAWLNLTHRRVVSGGSTLTMQVARMLERRPRTFGSKVIEAFRAVQLELRLSKDEILTAYANLAPYGGNIEGVGAAAFFYYEKEASQLSLDEAATLAAIPNAPVRLRPDRNPEALRARRDDVLERMVEAGMLSAEDARLAMALPLHAARKPAPFLAPHATFEVHRARPTAPRVRSTIDRALQLRAEKLLRDHAAELAPHGIGNAALVIIENDTRAVRAWVGSKDFGEAQVDGATSPRSPGSALKPFVYAMALDRGLIGPSSLVEDVPIELPGWAPSNFDERWRGVVPARKALQLSLNLPAVRLAQRLEPEGLPALLGKAGFARFQGDLRRYGLAAVLGGCEVELLELTNLYATLAQGGLHRPPKLVDGPAPEGVRLFSGGAAWLVSEMLTGVERPELADTWSDTLSIPRIAWKTGTSYGRRDAWSVGYSKRWTVGVWVGNFDGRGVPELVGVTAAAPLLFSIFRSLPFASTDAWIARPASVVEREVCALSGEPAGRSCPHTRMELGLAGTRRARCSLHVAMDVADDDGARLCPRCREGRAHHQEVHVVWPASVASWLEKAGVPIAPVPRHDARCSEGLPGAGPVIHTPLDGEELVLREGVPSEKQSIALVASVEGGVGPIYWFVDDRLLAAAPPGTRTLLTPARGVHRVAAADPEGRTRTITITVR